jgi:predicted permease
LGRFFLPHEEELGHTPVVVLSYGLWQRKFGGDAGIRGQSLDLDGLRYEVVGVAPVHFEDPFAHGALWRSRPSAWNASEISRGNHSWRVIARLAPGVTLEQAQADMDRIWSTLAQELAEDHEGEGAQLVRAKEVAVGKVRKAVLVLLGAVGLVLLIACANVANLLLTRTLDRSREVALRAALGAGRERIVRQLLTEVFLLFLAGGAAGLLLAWLGTDALLALAGESLPRVTAIRIDRAVLGFTLGICLVTAVVFGLGASYPALRWDLASVLRSASRGSTGDRGSQRLRGALVVAELALATVLLVGGGLLLKSLWRLYEVDPGLRAENVLTLGIVPRASSYPEPEAITRLYENVLERVSTVPGVQVAGAVNFLPMTGLKNCEFVWRDDLPSPEAVDLGDYDGPTCLEVRVVSPEYFRAMGIAIVAGRGFTQLDDEAGPAVAIINEAAAKVGFPDEEPVGKRVTLFETRDWLPNISREVVGVVRNVRHIGLAAEPVMAIYVPHAQEQDPGRRRSMTLALRTPGEPTRIAGAVRAAVWEVDKDLLIEVVQSMETLMYRTVASDRFRTVLLLVFGVVALLLAAVGVAGVVGYAVAQRGPEIGLRLALGARAGDIYTVVVSHGLRLVAMGLVVGLGGGLATTRLLSGLLYEITANDPVTFLAVALLLVVIAVVALWIPARKALRVDPVAALSSE